MTAEATPVSLDPAASAADVSELPFAGHYAMMGLCAEVRSNSELAICALDRLNAFFLNPAPHSPDPAPPEHLYEVVDHGEGLWEISYQDEVLCFRQSLERTVSHVEWHMCELAIAGLDHLLHVHGAAIAGPAASLLLPGTSGIGKTTLSLAIALRGKQRATPGGPLTPETQDGRGASGTQGGRRARAKPAVRLLSDDVVFLHTDTWRPESFPRAFHIHSDALPRLAALGLRWAPEEHFGAHLCSTVLGPTWDRAPGPPLRHVVFPRLDPGGPLHLEPLSEAVATVELMRYSKNLRRFPRFGLDMIPGLLSQVRCWSLQRNDDLVGAADLLIDLVA
jgi:hypothetical protein